MIRRKSYLPRSPVKQLIHMSKPNKYRAVKTLFNGRMYDSKGEGRCAAMLEQREKAGEIRNLRRQVVYDLRVNGEHICNYKADFVWEENITGTAYPWNAEHTGTEIKRVVLGTREVVCDYKGARTDIYRIKKKLMKACHGIDILELTAKDLR